MTSLVLHFWKTNNLDVKPNIIFLSIALALICGNMLILGSKVASAGDGIGFAAFANRIIEIRTSFGFWLTCIALGAAILYFRNIQKSSCFPPESSRDASASRVEITPFSAGHGGTNTPQMDIQTGRPKGSLVIIAMAIIILTLGSVLAFTLGRSSIYESYETATVENSSPTETAGELAEARLSAPEPNWDTELRKWLVGGWAEISTQCMTDDGQYFASDGRYANHSNEGRWSIIGSHLRTQVTHERNEEFGVSSDQEFIPLRSPASYSTQLTRDGQDRMAIMFDDGPVRFMRCPEAQYSFST